MNTSTILLVGFVGLVGLVIGFAMGRSQSASPSFQNQGEARLVHEARMHFPAPDYHLMNHITLQMQDGTTQVDHIVVSRFGVFVIETKYLNGWIFANAKHATWTQVMFQKKSQFQNPIFQNFRHLRAVQELLDFLPADLVKSVVVFTGDAEFKTEVPPGVFTCQSLSSTSGSTLLRQSPSTACSSALGGWRQLDSPSARRLTLSMSRTCTESTAHRQSAPSAGCGPASREETLGFEQYFCIGSERMSGDGKIADVGVVHIGGPLTLRCRTDRSERTANSRPLRIGPFDASVAVLHKCAKFAASALRRGSLQRGDSARTSNL